jgi:hypothetical protein
VHRMNEWLNSLASQPEFRDILRLTINGALSDFLFSQDGIAHDPLELPPHAFALDFNTWLSSASPDLPWSRFVQFLQEVTIWAGLLRIVAGRVTVTGVDSSFVTPELVRSNLERLLQTIQADLDLLSDAIGEGLLSLVSQQLLSVPATARFNVQFSTVEGDPASNRISVGRPGDTSHAEHFAQSLRERYFPGATS